MLLNSRFFEFLLATKNQQELNDFLPGYFDLLAKHVRPDMISRNYKRLKLKIPQFEIQDAALKLQIAQACFAQNDSQSVIKLLHGIHKKHPAFKDLLTALTLLADALDEYPKYAAHAGACRKLISRLNICQ